eukprot:scaffold16308_cov19-Tisochrysis_lutea.AAC.1
MNASHERTSYIVVGDGRFAQHLKARRTALLSNCVPSWLELVKALGTALQESGMFGRTDDCHSEFEASAAFVSWNCCTKVEEEHGLCHHLPGHA